MTTTVHDTAKIWGFATHELELGDASLIQDHLGDCPECREDLTLIRGVRSLAARAAEAIPVLDWARIDAAVSDLVESRTARTAGLAAAPRRWPLMVVPFAVLGAAAVALASHGGPSLPPSESASLGAAAMVPAAPSQPQVPTVLSAQAATRAKDGLKLVEGATLSAGDTVRTGKAGFALVRLQDGTRVRLGENAQLKLLRCSDEGAAASLERGRLAVQAERAFELTAGGFKARGVANVFSVVSGKAGVEVASAKGRVHVERPGLLPILVDTGRKAAFSWKSSAARLTTVSAADQQEFDKVILAPSVMVAALQRSMVDLPLATLTPAEAEVAASEWSTSSAPVLPARPQAQAARPVAPAAAPMPVVEALPVAEPESTPLDEREFAAFPQSLPPEATPLPARKAPAASAVLVAVAAPARTVAPAPVPGPSAAPAAAPARPAAPALVAPAEPAPIMFALTEPNPAPAPAPAPASTVVEAAPVAVVPAAESPESPEAAAMREALDSKRDLRIRNGMLIAEMQPTPKDVLEVEYAAVQARRAAAEYAPMPAAAPAAPAAAPMPAAAPAAPAAVAQPAPVAAPAPTFGAIPAQPVVSADDSADEAEELFLLRAERSLRKGNCQKFLSGLDEIAGDVPASQKTERARIARARCFQAQGKPGQAQSEYQRYLRETPAGDFAAEAQRSLPPAAAAQPRPPSALSDS